MEVILSLCLKQVCQVFFNKLSLGSDLNLLQSLAQMLESSKFMAQLHCNRQSVRYGLAKIHKALEDGILSFRLNLSAVGIIKDSFSFINEVLEFSVSLFMASFNIKSLLAKLPLTQTLNLCVQNLYRNQTHFGNLTKSSFCSLLRITMFANFFIFNGKFYEQCDGIGHT